MKNKTSMLKLLAVSALSFVAFVPGVFAQLTVPSDGSDGALNINSDTVIDLSQATTGTWNANNSAHAGKGVYDPEKWAIVFKYSSVNIHGNTDTNGVLVGHNVTFYNHPSHAPVVWLVQGDVAIDGIVNLDGRKSPNVIPEEYTPTEPGPGGFRGGAKGPLGQGAGYGPSGGDTLQHVDGYYSGAYGNPQILPLIGGSGGSAGYIGDDAASSGGGAILIVASGTVTINGKISAIGGGLYGAAFGARNASAGAIKIIANQILGAGTLDASGNGNASGRTRMEANILSPSLNVFPNVARVSPGSVPVIWPSANSPTVRIFNVGGQNAPSDPSANISTSADVGLQNTNSVPILLETKNLPINGTVSLRIVPKFGNSFNVDAAYVSGDVNQATWQTSAVMPPGYCVLQARATAP